MSAFGGKADITAKLITRDKARRIAVNIAELPEPFAEAVIRSVELIVQPALPAALVWPSCPSY
jgi:hypothetical protein